MKFFGPGKERNSKAKGNGAGGKARRRASERPNTQGGAPALVAHRLTKDLARAEQLAAMLAHSRAAGVVEVADLLAGMYIYDWERLSKYWPEQDAIEEYLQQICRISPQRWHHWIQFYDQQRRGDENQGKWKWLRPGTAAGAAAETDGKALGRSAELNALLRSAEEIAPALDEVDGRLVPILTCEAVLFAIAKRTDSEIGHRLVASGLNVMELEQAARNPRHAPLH
ncbi:MAG: hypothetical protein WB680_13335 [Candidatus Acidiferrales bacterium]